MAKNSVVDTEWLQRRIKEKATSGRGMAHLMELDSSVFNRMVNGLRPWRPEELTRAATLLETTVEELMRRTGTPVAVETKAMVPIIGLAAASGVINDRVPTPKRVERPAVSARDVVGIRLAKPGHWCDGYVYFYVPTASVEADAMRALAVCQVRGGQRYLGYLDRGKASGTYCVTPVPGSEPAGPDISLDWAAPVVWIKTR